MTSTRDLRDFPAPHMLKRRLQSLAMLDAMLEPEWQYRYHAFDARWSETAQMGSMRNGAGDDLFAWFGAPGCLVRGFDHESPMSPAAGDSGAVWPGVLDGVPRAFAAALDEPAFHMQDTTFCIWRGADETAWSVGAIAFPGHGDPDGSAWMLTPLARGPATYRDFAQAYYERYVDLGVVASGFAHAPLTQALLTLMESPRKLADVARDAEAIGYPVATGS